MGESRLSKWCLTFCNCSYSQYHRFKDLVRRYEAYLATHRRPRRGRKPANVENPVGELLGSWDDRGSVDPDDDYVRDDFLVDDGEREDEDEDSKEDSGGSELDNNNDDRGFDDDFQHEEVYDHHEVNTAGDLSGSSPLVERPSRASEDVSQASESDSDDDTSLDKLFNKRRAKRVSWKRKAEVGLSPSPQSGHQCEGEGSDDELAAQPPRKRHKGADHLMSCLRICSSADDGRCTFDPR